VQNYIFQHKLRKNVPKKLKSLNGWEKFKKLITCSCLHWRILILAVQLAKFVQNNLVTIHQDLDHKQVQKQNCMQLQNGM